MMEKVIKVDNEKAKSMIYFDEGVRFISKPVASIDEFNEIFDKKITFVDKGELKFSDMKKLSINGLVVNPHSGMKLGNSVSDISFTNDSDKDEFILHICNIKGWTKKETRLSPLNAIKWDAAGAVVTPIIAYVMYNQAKIMEAGLFVEETGYSKSARRGRFFDSILEMVGSNGVIIIATLIFLYLVYSIYKKYNNPPVVTSYE